MRAHGQQVHANIHMLPQASLVHKLMGMASRGCYAGGLVVSERFRRLISPAAQKCVAPWAQALYANEAVSHIIPTLLGKPISTCVTEQMALSVAAAHPSFTPSLGQARAFPTCEPSTHQTSQLLSHTHSPWLQPRYMTPTQSWMTSYAATDMMHAQASTPMVSSRALPTGNSGSGFCVVASTARKGSWQRQGWPQRQSLAEEQTASSSTAQAGSTTTVSCTSAAPAVCLYDHGALQAACIDEIVEG
jgi:hypothetical protein